MVVGPFDGVDSQSSWSSLFLLEQYHSVGSIHPAHFHVGHIILGVGEI